MVLEIVSTDLESLRYWFTILAEFLTTAKFISSKRTKHKTEISKFPTLDKIPCMIFFNIF